MEILAKESVQCRDPLLGVQIMKASVIAHIFVSCSAIYSVGNAYQLYLYLFVRGDIHIYSGQVTQIFSMTKPGSLAQTLVEWGSSVFWTLCAVTTRLP